MMHEHLATRSRSVESSILLSEDGYDRSSEACEKLEHCEIVQHVDFVMEGIFAVGISIMGCG